jgi:hypothetical protein
MSLTTFITQFPLDEFILRVWDVPIDIMAYFNFPRSIGRDGEEGLELSHLFLIPTKR